MNQSEAKALKWLSQTTGYDESEISFYHSTSPDFITPDGKGYEVKRPQSKTNSIQISERQWRKLLSMPDCVILVFRDKDIPEAVIPMDRLPFGMKRCNGYRFFMTRTDQMERSLYLSRVKLKAMRHEV